MTNRHQVNSLYLHYPHCRHLCNYCDFFKSVPADFDQARESFQSKLERHWELQAQWFEKLGYSFAPLETLYFGGGTPSLWDYTGAQWFESFMQGRLTLAKNYEWTMEVNPAAWTEKGLSAWEALGVNRFSMGVQSLDARYLKVLDRVHSLDDVEALLTRMKGKHFSVDLMLGLPFSAEWKRDLKFEIESLIERGAEHFSVYILTVKNNYKHFKELPSDEQIEAEFVLTSDILRAHGFDHYEVSNFAKAGARAKHNIRYWQGKSVAAIGPSAVGYLAPTGHRYKWKGQQDEFEIEELSSEAIELERVYLSLRLDSGLVDFEKGFSPEQKARYQILYQGWLNAGWINLNSDRKDLCLSPAGFLMMDSVIESLMKAELIK
ncbi:MAG: hypothetical protein CME71_02950 [Halobacteriovorax sp.]|nr:hypothetical protein [Halobacteriovorax sp.]